MEEAGRNETVTQTQKTALAGWQSQCRHQGSAWVRRASNQQDLIVKMEPERQS
jgi:hypothetical protein